MRILLGTIGFDERRICNKSRPNGIDIPATSRDVKLVVFSIRQTSKSCNTFPATVILIRDG